MEIKIEPCKMDIQIETEKIYPKLEDLNVVPKITSQNFNGAYKNVSIDAVTNEIDENIKPENIKKGVQILGIIGTFEGDEDEEKPNIENYITDGLIAKFEMKSDFKNSISDKYNVTNNGLTFVLDDILNRYVCKTGSGKASFPITDIDFSNFTISVLAKSDGENTIEHNMIFGFVGTGTNKSCIIKAHYGKLSVERYYGSINTDFNVNDDKWHRYTISVENNNIIKIYVDNILMKSQTGNLNISSTQGVIASYTGGFSFNWQGFLADALIYNRALTDTEVAFNFKNT